ncbi:MAG: S8 family peptidase [Dysgonamonadaceae bacterium]|jgi:subtilisin family serine protease|nr:S8 family peptidase [Dysgonamonadaceae bacterium]
MKQTIFIFLFFCATFSGYSQETFMYRLILKDKGNPPFPTEQPELFLSGNSIQRRTRQGLVTDSVDLPIDPSYFQAIANTGAEIRTFSKWVKTVVVHIPDSALIPQLRDLSFVDTLYCVWKGSLSKQAPFNEENEAVQNTLENDINSYGKGYTQIRLNNGHLLHDAGFRGQGMTIAVIDGGFINADVIDFFDFRRIKGVKNFNHETSDPLREGMAHGTEVLSCMLADKSGEMIGTAPEADYYLLRTEVSDEEYPVEEDYWVAALEYADSIGVDIVTSSLGYGYFDDSSMDHIHNQLDGKSVPISVAAGLAASRGILLFNSAGNERNKPWEKIMFPGDALNMLTIGAIDSDSVCSYFSSAGYTADGRVKPDLMAMGTANALIGSNGQIRYGSGTSYATPVLAGLGACLWQALPKLTAFEMIELLRETANAFSHPDSLMGYGIADVYKVYVQSKTGIKPVETENTVFFSVNSRENRLYLNFSQLQDNSKLVLNIYSGVGIKLLSVSKLSSPVDISSLPKGIYIARLQTGDRPAYVRKFIKM